MDLGKFYHLSTWVSMIVHGSARHHNPPQTILLRYNASHIGHCDKL
jgi:hypothetical protein